MVLNEYISFHSNLNFALNPEIIHIIEKTASNMGCFGCLKQLHYTREGFTKANSAPFDEFSQSRHSVRNYSQEKIPLEELISAVTIAQNAPSSCNRQPVRVYIITNVDLIKEILKLQGGTRGFGDLATALFVVTSNVSLFQDLMERWQPTLNAGFFGMSLLYALHFKKIGACTLNWSEDKRKDQALRKLLNIPEFEHIHFLISCGYLPDEFDIAASKRNKATDICKIID
jgi:nitroreductase